MANPGGHPATLQPVPGNTHSVKHTAYSDRLREPLAREIAASIMAAPHTVELDAIGAAEIGRLEALTEALDAAITQGGGRR